MRQTGILPTLLLSATGEGGQATDYIGSEYGAMRLYRRPNFPQLQRVQLNHVFFSKPLLRIINSRSLEATCVLGVIGFRMDTPIYITVLEYAGGRS